MSELKSAILDAKYIDMVSLADFVVQDCGLPDMDDDGNPLPQQNEVAAAIFRWAAMQDKSGAEAQPDAASGDPDTGGTFQGDTMNLGGEPQMNSGPTNWPDTGNAPDQATQGENR